MRKIIFFWLALGIFMLPFDFPLSRLGLGFPGIETFLVLLVVISFLLWEVLIIKEKRLNLIQVGNIDIPIFLLFAGYLFSSIYISYIRIWSIKYTLRLFGFSFLYYALLNFIPNKKYLSVAVFMLLLSTTLAAALAIIQPHLPKQSVVSLQVFFENLSPNPAKTYGPFVSLFSLVMFLSCSLPVGISLSLETYFKKKWRSFLVCLTMIAIISVSIIKLSREHGFFALFIDAQVPYLKLWERGIGMFLEHPFKGIGVDLFTWQFLDSAQPTLRTHNQFLEILVSLGLGGFLVFVWLMSNSLSFIVKGVSLKDYLRDNTCLRLGLAGGLILFFIISLFNNYLATHETIALFWVLIGLGVKAALIDAEKL